MAFESTLSIAAVTLKGAIDDVKVVELNAPTTDTKDIIQMDQDWEVQVKWHLEGSLLVSPFFTFTGRWVVRLFLEGMGTTQEYSLPAAPGQVVDVATFTAVAPDRRDYKATISIAQNSIDAGVYKPTIALTYESSPGTPGPIAGFSELGMLQVYDPS